jgi:DNA-directed RNA polymerase subunit RPC12/RpoP
MFTLITCPTCSHKFTVPEAAMGKRHSCPHCQALFTAGKSVADAPAEISMKQQAPAGDVPFNKTMLGETAPPAPPIKYNCPRCKKPLESPAIEAGTKKPCPFCGGRLQVPQAPPPSSGPPLNKTLLASDEGAPKPTTYTPQSPGYAPTSTAPSAPMTVPSTAPAGAATGPLGMSSKTYMIAGIVGGGFIFLVLLACVLTLATGGNVKAEKERWENAQKELADLKAEIAKRELDRSKQRDDEDRAARDKQRLKDKWDEEDRDYQRRLREIRDNQAFDDQKKLQLEQREKADNKRRELEKLEWEAKFDRLEKQRKQDQEDNDRRIREANNRAATVVVSPPPRYYHYHPYWGWGYW